MARKRRSIDPDLWSHLKYRRAPLVAREVWIALITLADDEGRVQTDALSLTEMLFSPRTHHVGVSKVEEALALWEREGWLLRYGEDCIFLTGWYEHQYIPERDRQPSSLPPPPSSLGQPYMEATSSLGQPYIVNSWLVADAIRDAYAVSRKGSNGSSKPQFRSALRAFTHLSGEEQETILSQTCAKHVSNMTEGKGREVFDVKAVKALGRGMEEGNDSAASDDAGDPPTDLVRELTPTQQAIQNAWEAFGQTGIATDPPESKRRRYSGLVRLVQEHGIPVVEEWCAWLRTHPETVPEGSPPWPYFCTRFKQAMAAPSGVGWRKTDPDLFSGPVTAKRIANAPEPDREKFRSAAEGPKPTSGNLGSP